jgi:hypothetical protein
LRTISAFTAEAEGWGTPSGAGYGSGHGDAIVEGASDERRLAGARDAGDDELCFVYVGVGLEVVDDARDAPGPGSEEAPVVLGVGRKEAGGAIGPASIGEAECGVFAAVVVVEGDEGVAVGQGRVGGGDLLRGAGADAFASTRRKGAGLGDHGAGDEEGVLAFALVGSLRETGKRGRSGWGAGGGDDGWRRRHADRGEDTDVEAQAIFRAEGEMDEAVLYLAVDERLFAEDVAHDVSGRRGREAHDVVLEGGADLFAALLPLGRGADALAVVEDHRVGHLGAIRQGVGARHGIHAGVDFGERDLFGIGARGQLGRCGDGACHEGGCRECSSDLHGRLPYFWPRT